VVDEHQRQSCQVIANLAGVGPKLSMLRRFHSLLSVSVSPIWAVGSRGMVSLTEATSPNPCDRNLLRKACAARNTWLL
jgi:hypothetical protein